MDDAADVCRTTARGGELAAIVVEEEEAIVVAAEEEEGDDKDGRATLRRDVVRARTISRKRSSFSILVVAKLSDGTSCVFYMENYVCKKEM